MWLSILSKRVFGDIQAEIKKRLLYSIYGHMAIYGIQETLFETLPPLPPLQGSRPVMEPAQRSLRRLSILCRGGAGGRSPFFKAWPLEDFMSPFGNHFENGYPLPPNIYKDTYLDSYIFIWG